MKLQHVIILVLVLTSAGVGTYFYQEAKYNGLIEDIKADLQAEKEQVIKQKAAEEEALQETITKLISENEKAKADSQYWYQQAKKRGVNPDYDIDFITAADIITKSRYRPGE